MMIRLWTRLGRPYAGRILLAGGLAAGGGLMAALLLGVSGWFLTASALAGASGAGLAFNHLYPSATVRGTAMGRILSRYAEQLVGHDATLRLSARLRRRLFEATARSRTGLARPDSDSLSVFMDDVGRVESALLKLWLPLAGAIAAAGVALVFAGLAGPGPLAAVVAGFGLAAAAGGFGMAEQRRIDARLRQLNDRFRRDAAALVENRVELEALGQFGTAADGLGALAGDTARQTLQAGRRARLAAASTAGIGGLSAIAAVALGGPAGTAILAGTALSVLAAHQSLALALSAWAAWPATALAIARVDARLAAPPGLEEPDGASLTPATILPVEITDLVVGVTGSAVTARIPALCLGPASVTEITGPSGAGKTTLLETLARLRPPLAGQLRYAGIAADALRTAAVRQHVGLAPQMPDVMAGPVRDALRLAQPDADDARLREACDTALFSPVLDRSPDGLDRLLDDGGANLSGGELRRFAIARALLRGPDLLLLDEPFAGLDAPTRETLARRLAEWACRNDAAIALVTHSPDAALWPGPDYQRVELGR